MDSSIAVDTQAELDTKCKGLLHNGKLEP